MIILVTWAMGRSALTIGLDQACRLAAKTHKKVRLHAKQERSSMGFEAKFCSCSYAMLQQGWAHLHSNTVIVSSHAPCLCCAWPKPSCYLGCWISPPVVQRVGKSGNTLMKCVSMLVLVQGSSSAIQEFTSHLKHILSLASIRQLGEAPSWSGAAMYRDQQVAYHPLQWPGSRSELRFFAGSV